MKSNIYLDANPYEVRVAVVEDDSLAELYVERKGSERIVGNIYKGVVKNVLPGMQAAFVDIGIERNAFLYAGDISVDAVDEELPEVDEKAKCVPDIRKLVKVGQSIMVQVLKEPFGTKGARVTTNITLPGYKVVLLPKASYVGISRKIEEEEERTRLKTILEEIRPQGRGVIARTSAMGASREELCEQIQSQMDIYRDIHTIYDSCKAPKLIHSEENIYYRTVRDAFSSDIDGFYISSREAYDYVTSLVTAMNPSLLSRVKFFDAHYDMFEYHGLEARIDKALARRVWLKSGGYLVFDSAEALTVIDVNTGKFVGTNSLQDTILKTNMEAAEEIARQIRLRDISGIIVVDFIDMEDPCNRQKILEVLREAVKRDRTRTIILGITDLGIVELTRKKTKQSLATVFYAPCPYCEGEGTILSAESMAMKARKEVYHRFYRDGYKNVVIMAHPAVCMEINAKMKKGAELISCPAGHRVFLQQNGNMHIEHMEVEGVLNPQDAINMGAQPLCVKE
ncbi:MAG: Rne/Rng family ribonuclease [Clostridiales bacterium]|nr:Rne/Rng family ribonuclease [Clostridiales bacterium]